MISRCRNRSPEVFIEDNVFPSHRCGYSCIVAILTGRRSGSGFPAVSFSGTVFSVILFAAGTFVPGTVHCRGPGVQARLSCILRNQQFLGYSSYSLCMSAWSVLLFLHSLMCFFLVHIVYPLLMILLLSIEF